MLKYYLSKQCRVNLIKILYFLSFYHREISTQCTHRLQLVQSKKGIVEPGNKKRNADLKFCRMLAEPLTMLRASSCSSLRACRYRGSADRRLANIRNTSVVLRHDTFSCVRFCTLSSGVWLHITSFFILTHFTEIGMQIMSNLCHSIFIYL